MGCCVWKSVAVRSRCLALSVAGILLAAGDALAGGDNVAEARFQVIISEPGTYRLTEDVIVTDANTTAIEIDADNVTIDMNGFSIRGPGTCTPPPVSCAPRGSGNGIHAVTGENIVVRNGAVYGMGNVGIYLETNSVQIDNMRLSGNGEGGIVAFGGVVNNNSIVVDNGGDGIAGLDILLQKSIIRGNGQFGFKAYAKSSYFNNTFIGNNSGGAQVNSHPRQGRGNTCDATNCR
jgi:hypothetical protein